MLTPWGKPPSSAPDSVPRPEGRDPAVLRSDRAFLAFSWYLRWYLSRRFRAVRLALDGLPAAAPGRPLVVYTNHPSWWDPAVFMVLAATLFPDRRGFGPMDEESLGRYGVLERMGVFGIDVTSPRGAARFLRVSRSLLDDARNMMWITAEGEFVDARARPVALRPGLAHLVRLVPNTVVLPLAVEYTFWNESRPEALARFGAPVDIPAGAAVAETTALLTAELVGAMDALRAASIQRDPKLFRTLVRGSAGVGGIYDLYRRGRAAVAGRRFDPTHGGRA